MENKQCPKCQLEKPIGEFYIKQSWCKECLKSYAIDYKHKHPERFKQAQEKYKNANREKFRQWKRDWDRKAMQDPVHRLSNNLRGNMYHALKAMKGFRKWEDLVGYTIGELAKHLESQFTEGITWDNYGSHWHIDHITPKSWFKYQSTNDASFKECWALKNLQPKLKVDNIRKGNRSIG